MKKKPAKPTVPREAGPTTLQAQLLAAIEQSGLTRYRIAEDAGVDYYSLSRFLEEGRDIRLSSVEKLAAYFGMTFTKPKTPKGSTEPPQGLHVDPARVAGALRVPKPKRIARK